MPLFYFFNLSQRRYKYCAPLTLKKTISSNKKAANRRVEKIRAQLAHQAASSASTTAQQSPSEDNVTRHCLDTDDVKHDERGEVVPAPAQNTAESLDE